MSSYHTEDVDIPQHYGGFLPDYLLFDVAAFQGRQDCTFSGVVVHAHISTLNYKYYGILLRMKSRLFCGEIPSFVTV